METTTEKNKKSTIWKVSVAMLVIIFAGLLAIYIYGVLNYTDCFFMGTYINGVDYSGKTLEDVENDLQKEVENYRLEVILAEDQKEYIEGTQIGILHESDGAATEAFEAQNSYLWVTGLFQKTEIETKVTFSYDEEKLSECIKQMECMQEKNQIKPMSAYIEFADNRYVIRPEVAGTKLKAKKVNEVISKTVANMETSVNLVEEECYVKPKYTEESTKLKEARNQANQYLSAEITYSLDGIEIVVNGEMISEWVSITEDHKVVLDEDGVRSFTDTLGASYNTPDKDQILVSPTGKEVKISGAAKGRLISSEGDCEQLIEEIKAGKVVTREPVIARNATSTKNYAWGDTYTEVDLSQQHMWYIENGKVVFECDVVTGSPGRSTPSGMFTILEKKRNKTLLGNIMENGEREYETPVSYWARVTWSGVGFHDATWQEEFGGKRYKEGYGSHGCINMPLGAAGTFYGLVSVGCPVIIHY